MSADRLSLREFARRDGCAESLVRRACKEGRLQRGDDGKISADLVGTEWRHGNATGSSARAAHSQRAQGAQPGAQAAPANGMPTYSESLARKEAALARLREMEVQKAAGLLVSLETARGVLFDEARATRDAWLNWPARVSALMASDLGVEADRMAEVLTAYVHKQISALADPDGSKFVARQRPGAAA